MLKQVKSFALSGIKAYVVNVEADVKRGLAAFNIVGLPDASVKEAKDRIISALSNSSIEVPLRKILINLAPANVKKAGTQFDLAIAVGVMLATGRIRKSPDEDTLFIGELSLSGDVKPCGGILPAMLMASKKGIKKVFITEANCSEAATVKGIEIMPVKSLAQLEKHLNGDEEISPFSGAPVRKETVSYPDFCEVQKQEFVKRALEVAAAGGHNVLMIGPPGSGKTMLAKRLPGILPPMTEKEAVETTCIYSASGMLPEGTGLMLSRPWRAPHHTISDVALVGGGSTSRPGEISLAHNGILFLDEFPEFHRNVLEVLRAPLEDGEITIARVRGRNTFPASFMLVAAMNPCPCGYHGHPVRECVCTPYQVKKYRSKISGPIMDRIDIQVEVPALKFDELYTSGAEEKTSAIAARVKAARRIALERLKRVKGIYTNSRLSSALVGKLCRVTPGAEMLLKRAVEMFSISRRAVDKVLKVSRTIADLAASDGITEEHVAEALQYRLDDPKL